MSIYLRRSCLAVPEYLADYVQALAFAHRYRCEAVPQVMYSEAWDIGEGSYFRPNRAERDDVPPPRDAGNTNSDPSTAGMLCSKSTAGPPSGTVFAPVLLSGNRIQHRSKSTHFHLSPVTSPRRHPLRSSSLSAVMAVGFSPSASSLDSASPIRPISEKERNRSRRCVARSLTPCAGLSASRPRDTAKPRSVLSTATLRAAMPFPPDTIARPRGLVLTSAFDFPAATS